jgi:hypothetical protein
MAMEIMVVMPAPGVRRRRRDKGEGGQKAHNRRDRTPTQFPNEATPHKPEL